MKGNIDKNPMCLLAGWVDALDQSSTLKPAAVVPLPKSPEWYSAGLHFVDNATTAADMVQLALERKVCHIGWDTEFRYTSQGVPVSKKHTHYDVRSIKPLLLSLAFAERHGAGLRLFRFVVNLREPEVLSAAQQILRLPLPFVGHYSHVELMSLWQLGLTEPKVVWDTWVAEKVSHLGLFNKQPGSSAGATEARDAEQHEGDEALRYDLVSTCRRHGVEYSLAGEKKRLQQSFLDCADNAPFTQEQIDYAALDAEAGAKLYLPQVIQATARGDLQHLITIEMPWVAVNARVAWNGVRVDPSRRQRVRDACDRLLPRFEQKLAGAGISNSRSHPQLQAFFREEKLLEFFRAGDGYSFDKDHLKELCGRHPVINLLHEARRIQSVTSDKILWPQLVGTDGRIHADHRQLGAASGRQSTKFPNLLGLDRHMRPLIVPDEGCGIGEVDLSQIEVGIAAAVYADEALVAMFNRDDVYCEMAKLFFKGQLTQEDLKLCSSQFKKKHDGLRAVMKTCTLGIIYGMTSFGIANRLNISQPMAAEQLQRFMAMFPKLTPALADTVRLTAVRGYAVTATGLKRYRSSQKSFSNWERNWAKNHPVQGTAAALFKLACIRLMPLYRQYDAKLILPVHDAVVFECPLSVLKDVAELTRQVLCAAVQEFFPQLRPRAEININHPECWNKDGQANALESWFIKAERLLGTENITTTSVVAAESKQVE
jgi:DNA polymerase I